MMGSQFLTEKKANTMAYSRYSINEETNSLASTPEDEDGFLMVRTEDMHVVKPPKKTNPNCNEDDDDDSETATSISTCPIVVTPPTPRKKER